METGVTLFLEEKFQRGLPGPHSLTQSPILNWCISKYLCVFHNLFAHDLYILHTTALNPLITVLFFHIYVNQGLDSTATLFLLKKVFSVEMLSILFSIQFLNIICLIRPEKVLGKVFYQRRHIGDRLIVLKWRMYIVLDVLVVFLIYMIWQGILFCISEV